MRLVPRSQTRKHRETLTRYSCPEWLLHSQPRGRTLTTIWRHTDREEKWALLLKCTCTPTASITSRLFSESLASSRQEEWLWNTHRVSGRHTAQPMHSVILLGTTATQLPQNHREKHPKSLAQYKKQASTAAYRATAWTMQCNGGEVPTSQGDSKQRMDLHVRRSAGLRWGRRLDCLRPGLRLGAGLDGAVHSDLLHHELHALLGSRACRLDWCCCSSSSELSWWRNSPRSCAGCCGNPPQ